MHHQHAHAYLVRRQRQQQQHADDLGFVATIISVEILTPTRRATAQPIETLIDPAVRSRPVTTQDDNQNQPQQTRAPGTTSRKPSSNPAQATDKTAPALMVATNPPVPSAAVTTSITTTTAAAAASNSSAGMSTTAKAGLALGILFGIGALLIGILVIYKRKRSKNTSDKGMDEKMDLHDAPPPPPPQVGAMSTHAPSIHAKRASSAAPRLSLRPVTQFDPALSEQGKNGEPMLNSAAVGDRRPSAWERPGAQHSPAQDPFSDPTNPFANNAAVDARQAHIPDSPPHASPMYHGSKFANPGAVIAASDIDPVAMAGAVHSVPPPGSELPLLPNQAISRSPAYVEDFPASPGPAPTGPPPVASGMVGPPPGPNNVHRIQLDFKASMADELNLQAGQLVRMLHEYDDGWALCTRMDRSQQGVVPRTCLSKHPVKPRTGPPHQGPPPPGVRGPPIRPQLGPGGVSAPRPQSPANGRTSPNRPQGLQPTNHRASPNQRSLSPGPQGMSLGPQMQSTPRARSNSNAPYAQPQRSMSPGPYGGGPQMQPPHIDMRARSNSAGPAGQQRSGTPSGPSPMSPKDGAPIPARKPVPGIAI